MVSTFNQQINSLTQTLNEQLIKTQGNIGQQLEGTIKIISNVQTKLGELSETAKNMEELGKDIKKLENILQAPKLRGNIGEFFLEDLLKQILPGQNYEIQYRFKDNTVVDAVIKIGEHLVPVDSKFPLESFNRIVEANTEEEKKRAKREFVDSLKKKIDEIANKYIRPAENTYEFALMYIPAENVFYEMIIRDDQLIGDKNLSNYAIEKRVIPVSPNSFYAYLMVIIFGLKGMQIEKEAQNIRGRIGELQQNFKKFYEIFTKIGKNIYFAQKYYEDAKRIAEIFGDRMALVSGEKVELKELSE
jgi:DNA recombination protein RmuC